MKSAASASTFRVVICDSAAPVLGYAEGIRKDGNFSDARDYPRLASDYHVTNEYLLMSSIYRYSVRSN